MVSSEDKPLPQFRDDLKLYQGPENPDGAPTFNIFDPVKGRYYKISWGESLIIKHLKPDMTARQLSEKINSETTLGVNPKEIIDYLQEAAKHNLLSLPRSSTLVQKEADHVKQSFFKKLVMHYLYVRIPLFEPNDFLEKTLKYVKPLASTTAFVMYALISLLGLGYLFVYMEEFIHTFLYFFTIKGMIAYALALTLVKIIHELAHAYTAVNFKVRVPVMGVILLVLWPVLFTDVTDGWKLKNRKHRLYISLAGIIVETSIAGLCTFGWAISSPGLMKSVFFVVSSASWVSTLLMNANPLMRFDGYYILSDLWGVDNLQSRAFSAARWKFRSVLFGLETPCPVSEFTKRRIKWLIVYAVCMWIYRLILYTTIAVFVYFSFTKTVGIVLFIVEIHFFIIRPFLEEIRMIFLLRRHIVSKSKLIIFCAVVSLVLFWLCVPMPRTKRFPAITVPSEEQVVYVPYDSVVVAVGVKRNQVVSKNAPVVILQSRVLEAEYKKYTAEAKLITQEIKLMGLSEKGASHIPEKARELEGIFARRNAIEQKIKSLALKADIFGTVIGWDENLRVGQAVSKDQVLGKIADVETVKVVSFVPEDVLNSIYEGMPAVFSLKSDGTRFPGKIKRINPVRASRLQYPSLGSIYHGPLPVAKDASDQLVMIETFFPVLSDIDADDEDLKYGRMGYLQVEGIRDSIALAFLRKVGNLLWRESSF